MRRCEPVRVAECCGFDASDVSPILIVSCLATRWQPDPVGAAAKRLTDLERFRRGLEGALDNQMLHVDVLTEKPAAPADEIVAAMGIATGLPERYDGKG